MLAVGDTAAADDADSQLFHSNTSICFLYSPSLRREVQPVHIFMLPACGWVCNNFIFLFL